MGSRRIYRREFKLMVVGQVANGEKRPAQFCREHDLGESLLLHWRQEYDARGSQNWAHTTIYGPFAQQASHEDSVTAIAVLGYV